MKLNKKILKNVLSFLVIAAIFYFLGKSLVDNWQKIKDYHFNFNYYLLIISILLLVVNIFFRGIIWNKILRIFEPEKRMSHIEAIKINTYANFGKYLPGKVWGVVGSVYLGAKKGISRKSLAISYTLLVVIGILVGLMLGLVLLFIALNGNYYFSDYLIILSILPILILFIRPRLVTVLINNLLKIIKRELLPPNFFLNRRHLASILIYLSISRLFNGFAFYLFVCSIISLPWSAALGIIGIFIIANTAGFAALFASGGIGVREGIISVLLGYYLTGGLNILIALMSRVWVTIGDVLAFAIAYFYPERFEKFEQTDKII